MSVLSIVIEQREAIGRALAAIVGEESVSRPDLEGRLSQALSPGTQMAGVVYPNTPLELAEVVACAHRNHWQILPIGNGSKIDWGGLVSGEPLIGVSTARLDRVIEHAIGDLTLTAEAGVCFADLQATLAKAGQFLAIDPTYPNLATLGGIVATADTGSWRQRYGSVRDMLLGVSLVRADGQIVKAGGRVVKNVAGYDLMKLFTGSYGTLGIITQVTFRLYPLPEASQTVVLSGASETIAEAAQTILSSALTPIALDLLSPQLVASLGIGKGMALITRFQSIAASVKEQANRLLEVGQILGLSSSLYSEADEADLWQRLPTQMERSLPGGSITCKIGVRSSEAVAVLVHFDRLTSQPLKGLIHTGSGIGQLCLPEAIAQPETLLQLRQICQSNGGFLSVLQAPIALKQQVEVWGYTGDAIDLMRRLKQQFDPESLLSPHRFVGGI